MAETELPLRIIRQDDRSLAIRCLCGAEGAVARGVKLSEEISPAMLLRMILHASTCRSVPGRQF